MTPLELDRIRQKALEQAIRQADLAKTEPVLLLPVVPTWPFPLSQDDRDFLHECLIDPA